MSFTDARKLRSGGLGMLLFAAITSFCLTNVVEARAFRPGQIPNGFENGCQNCHMSAFGGDARNPFGAAVTLAGDPDSHPPERTAVAESSWASVKSFMSKLVR